MQIAIAEIPNERILQLYVIRVVDLRRGVLVYIVLVRCALHGKYRLCLA